MVNPLFWFYELDAFSFKDDMIKGLLPLKKRFQDFSF